jgi:NADPH:quinone reductase-like Zn-dependent oxidoreductase
MSQDAADMLAVEFDTYGGPEVLKMRRRVTPELAPGELLVRVRAVSMNPVDWKVRSGMLQKFFAVTFPVVTGRDGAGEVIAAGSGADSSLVGRRVCFLAPRGIGTWCERIALPEAEAVLFPEALPFEQAASLPLAGISAWIAIVRTANVTPGMRVLIHAAAGGVGSLAVQLARIHGAEVIATCSQAMSITSNHWVPKPSPTTQNHSMTSYAMSTWFSTSSAAMCTGAATECSSAKVLLFVSWPRRSKIWERSTT